MTKKIHHRYDWVPDLPDQRDFRHSLKKPKTEILKVTLPKKVDLRQGCSPVFNQGEIGSCTSQALAGMLEYLQLMQLKIDDGNPELEVYDDSQFTSVSRLFIYYNERLLEGTIDQDSGASLRNGIKTLVSDGNCREEIWPYENSRVFKKPTPTAYREAKKHKILSYLKLDTLQDMRQTLSQGFPFVFGFTVYESFESSTVAKTGNRPLPKKSESTLGGHAVMAVGYDDLRKNLLVRNSWGPGWGDHGYFRMPYAYAE